MSSPSNPSLSIPTGPDRLTPLPSELLALIFTHTKAPSRFPGLNPDAPVNRTMPTRAEVVLASLNTVGLMLDVGYRADAEQRIRAWRPKACIDLSRRSILYFLGLEQTDDLSEHISGHRSKVMETIRKSGIDTFIISSSPEKDGDLRVAENSTSTALVDLVCSALLPNGDEPLTDSTLIHFVWSAPEAAIYSSLPMTSDLCFSPPVEESLRKLESSRPIARHRLVSDLPSRRYLYHPFGLPRSMLYGSLDKPPKVMNAAKPGEEAATVHWFIEGPPPSHETLTSEMANVMSKFKPTRLPSNSHLNMHISDGSDWKDTQLALQAAMAGLEEKLRSASVRVSLASYAGRVIETWGRGTGEA